MCARWMAVVGLTGEVEPSPQLGTRAATVRTPRTAASIAPDVPRQHTTLSPSRPHAVCPTFSRCARYRLPRLARPRQYKLFGSCCELQPERARRHGGPAGTALALRWHISRDFHGKRVGNADERVGVVLELRFPPVVTFC